MAWPPLGKSQFTVRIMDRFKSFFHGIDRQNDPDAAKKSKALKLAQFNLADQHNREKEITDADIDAAAKEALAKVKPDNDEDEDFAAPSARAAAPPVASKPAAVDHTTAIATLTNKVGSLETQVNSLTTENTKLKAAMGAGKQPGPTPSAQAASLQGEERLAQLVLEVDKCRSDMAVNAFMTLHGAEVAALMMGNRNLMQYTLAFPNWARFAKKN